MVDEKRLTDVKEVMSSLRTLLDKNKVYKDTYSYKAFELVYKRLEEAPTVDAIVSPVKIGHVLWCNIPHSGFPLECRVYCICREERNGLVLNYFRCVVKGWFAKAFCFEDVGKTVFFTKEEALAKMDGGNEDG